MLCCSNCALLFELNFLVNLGKTGRAHRNGRHYPTAFLGDSVFRVVRLKKSLIPDGA